MYKNNLIIDIKVVTGRHIVYIYVECMLRVKATATFPYTSVLFQVFVIKY